MGTNEDTRKLLAAVVDDFDAVHRAYEKAGLLAEDARTEAAKKLLGNGDDVYRFKREFLLADALIRNRVGRAVHGSAGGGDDGPRHLAVFGGNNVGKSTVVNIVAAQAVAGVSPEGGHTRHAQAFVPPPASKSRRLFGDNPYAFRRFIPAGGQALPGDKFDLFGERPVTSGALPANVVLWDTPDCDATESRKYMAAVVEAAAAADAVVYVTSLERYAVAHLIEWVFLFHEAGIDLIECLNRTRRKDQPLIIKNQRNRHFPEMARQLNAQPPDFPIVGLRYMVEGEEEDLWGPDHPEAAQLRADAVAAAEKADRAKATATALDFVGRRLDRLLEPARLEVLATEQWVAAVGESVKDFVRVYEEEYLTSDKVIEPFSRLNVELLNLLDPDIPGLKPAIKAIRWVTRWPARLVLAIGRKLFSVMFGGDKDDGELPPELKAYSDAHGYVLNNLGALITKSTNAPRHHPFWEALGAAWDEQLKPLSDRFGQMIRDHMAETDRKIRSAAKDILEQMGQRPILLNTLRSVRVTANVGGVLVGFFLPVKGGFVYDLLEELIIAPAIMTGVEAATTGAVESYVRGRRDELVEQLKRDARSIAGKLYRDPLLGIADVAIGKAGTMGLGKEVLDRLPDEVERLRKRVVET